jgi:selenocysteine lyase/cysteine desulfurase
MLEHSGDFDRRDWQPAEDARRFECGSPNLLGVHALEASLSLIEEVGIEHVRRELQTRTAHLIEGIDRHGLELLSPRAAERRAGIVTFRVPGRPSAQLYPELMRRRVLCAQRGGGIRFSPHFYTPFEVIDRALEEVLSITAD